MFFTVKTALRANFRASRRGVFRRAVGRYTARRKTLRSAADFNLKRYSLPRRATPGVVKSGREWSSRGVMNLRGKLHRITPLRYVLDFLALVNLMNQIGRMIDQPHARPAALPSCLDR
jgi:hypothetical protein